MSKIKYFIKSAYWQGKKRRYMRACVRRAQNQYDQLVEKKDLTEEQKKEVVDYYEKLIGVKVPLVWHQYYFAKTGKFAKELIPGTLREDLIAKANQVDYRNAYADKNMLDVYLPGVCMPKSILKNLNGYFYMDGEPITREEAIQRLQNIDIAIIKPSLECEGIGVHKLKVENGITNINGMTLDQLFRDEYGDKNFIIQEWVEQHERLADLNPSSLNTIRTVTFRLGMEILVLFSSIRIGRKGSEIDNLNAGGISAVVNSDGTLGEYGYLSDNESCRKTTDSGVVLDGYQIPSYDKAIDFVKNLHYKLPFFDLIGWDIAINKNGEPVIIEWNVRPGFSQLSYGPAFGENTERIIKILWPRENTRNAFW